MKMRRMCVIILMVSLFVLSCSSKTDKTNAFPKGMRNGKITIFMQGDKGTDYSGRIQVISSDGISAGQTVEGSVPEVYEFEGVIVSASFQKKGDNSRDLLVLITDEEHFPNPVKMASTTAPFGVATVSLSLSSTKIPKKDQSVTESNIKEDEPAVGDWFRKWGGEKSGLEIWNYLRRNPTQGYQLHYLKLKAAFRNDHWYGMIECWVNGDPSKAFLVQVSKDLSGEERRKVANEFSSIHDGDWFEVSGTAGGVSSDGKVFIDAYVLKNLGYQG